MREQDRARLRELLRECETDLQDDAARLREARLQAARLRELGCGVLADRTLAGATGTLVTGQGGYQAEIISDERREALFAVALREVLRTLGEGRG